MTKEDYVLIAKTLRTERNKNEVKGFCKAQLYEGIVDNLSDQFEAADKLNFSPEKFKQFCYKPLSLTLLLEKQRAYREGIPITSYLT